MAKTYQRTLERRKEQRIKNERLGKIRDYLKQYRAQWKCELRRHPDCNSRGFSDGRIPLSPHHISKRSHGRVDEPYNLIIVCAECHAICEGEDRLNPKPTKEYLLDLTNDLNIRYNISKEWVDASL